MVELMAQKRMLGKKIKRLRQGLDLNQHDFGEKIGTQQHYISACETGKSLVSMEKVLKIIEVYGVKFSYFDFPES